MKLSRFLLVSCLAAALAPASSVLRAQTVRGWEGTIRIPTYKLGPPDPNPAFPLVSRNPVYPYMMLDNLTDDRVVTTYRALYLENQYLRITILPELGGHVYSVYDKVNQREVLYRNHVIKYGLVGPRGAWIAGGMEFSFPFAHTTDTVSPVESVLQHHPDGSVTAVVGAVDWVSDMHWEIAITLRPDTARVEEGVTLFNSTPSSHLYLFWTNTAVKATDDAQYIYPMRETIYDDPYATVQSWPIEDGVDRSWYKNDPGPLAIFGRNVHRNFFGVYYHQSNYGVVHVADFRQDPGKKFWTWGTAPGGKIWDTILSDQDGSYDEIQSGRFYTQGSRELMSPGRVEKWTEYWYPVRGLDGGFLEATNQMAMNVRSTKGPDGQAQTLLLLSPVADVQNARVTVSAGPKVLRSESRVHLTPMETKEFQIPLAASASENNLTVDVFSSAGATLLHWSAKDPADGNPDGGKEVGKVIKKRIAVTPETPVEQLYYHAVFLEKAGDADKSLETYKLVLQRDPDYVPALLKMAWYSYRQEDFRTAMSFIERALERDNDNHAYPSLSYAAGIILRAEGKPAEAKDALWTAIHYGAASAPGALSAVSYAELGRIAMQEHNYQEAAGLFKRALSCNAEDALVLTELAAAERLAGDRAGAIRDSAEALKKMPLLPNALVEHWQDTSSDASWKVVLSSDPNNYLAVASWYYSMGMWDSSAAVLQAALRLLPGNSASPMFYYYLAADAERQGHLEESRQDLKLAMEGNSEAVFPNRLTDAAVLRLALEANPADAHAQFALGNFLFAKARYDDAAELWTRALQEGMQSPVLLRNLGVHQWQVKSNLAEAASLYSRALHLAPHDHKLYVDLDEIDEERGATAERAALFASAPPDVAGQDTVIARRAILALEQSRPEDALARISNHHFKPWEGGVVVHNIYVAANMLDGKKAMKDHQPLQAADNFRKAMLYPESLGTGRPADADDSEQLYWLGNALEAAGQADQARIAWEEASRAASVYSAMSNRKLGRQQAADQILDRLIQAAAAPDASAADFYNAGMAELARGNQEAASSDWKQAVRLDPQLWQARIASGQN